MKMKTIYNKKGEFFKFSEDYCIETYPCEHYVEYFESIGEIFCDDGNSIYKYLVENNYNYEDFKHFHQYEDYDNDPLDIWRTVK
jgi:hypothetical protein